MKHRCSGLTLLEYPAILYLNKYLDIGPVRAHTDALHGQVGAVRLLERAPMAIQSLPGSLLRSRPIPGFRTDTARHLSARPSRRRLLGLPVQGTQTGWSVSTRRQRPRLSSGPLTRTSPDSRSPVPAERSPIMRPSRPSMRVSLAWLLTLGLRASPLGSGGARRAPRSVGRPSAGMAGHEARGGGGEREGDRQR